MPPTQLSDQYKPDGAFEVDSRDPLVDLHLDDSKELWLLQWPPNQIPVFSGKEISLNLQSDGYIGSFEGFSGKTYDMLNCVHGGQDATVFLSSPSGARIVGKISRRVSLVRYVDPEELEQQEAERKSKRNQLGAGSSFITSSLNSTPTQSTKLRSSQTSRGHTVTTNSSRQKSSLSEVGEKSHRKKRRIHETAASADRSTLVSGQGCKQCPGECIHIDA